MALSKFAMKPLPEDDYVAVVAYDGMAHLGHITPLHREFGMVNFICGCPGTCSDAIYTSTVELRGVEHVDCGRGIAICQRLEEGFIADAE